MLGMLGGGYVKVTLCLRFRMTTPSTFRPAVCGINGSILRQAAECFGEGKIQVIVLL